MDRGFEFMIPKAKEEEKKESIFNHKIKLTFLGKEFSLDFRVKQNPE